MLDDIEGTISSSHNIIVVRAAGNGFKNSSDQFVGPIQTKMISGSRTAGYADNTNGGVNNVDKDQKKICVGASEYNDRWADFSNYGAGVTTVTPVQEFYLHHMTGLPIHHIQARLIILR